MDRPRAVGMTPLETRREVLLHVATRAEELTSPHWARHRPGRPGELGDAWSPFLVPRSGLKAVAARSRRLPPHQDARARP